MEDKNQYLESITEIRSMMERSSKFLSLSGLSGVAAGLTAIAAAVVAYLTNNGTSVVFGINKSMDFDHVVSMDRMIFYFLLAGLTLFIALGLAFLFTFRKAKKNKLSIWDKTAQRVMVEMSVPLIVGGLFIMIQIFNYGIVTLVAPTMLIFYGLALFGAGKYTVKDTRWLGIAEIVLGMLSLLFFGYGFLFWIIGFGVFHIIYGVAVYLKYDRKY